MAQVAGGAPRSLGDRVGLTWRKTLEWLSQHTSLPIVLKGIQTHEDAYAATLFPSIKGHYHIQSRRKGLGYSPSAGPGAA